MSERTPARRSELEPPLVQAFANTFIPRWDRYAFQRADGRYVQVEEPLTLQHVFDHLTAFRLRKPPLTLGAYALRPDHKAQWLCFDADDADRWQGLLALAHTLAAQDIPAYREPSRRGGHLWLFTPLLSGVAIRKFGTQLLSAAQLSGIEIYPKQDRLLDGPGSFVRLPLGLHQRNGEMYPFIDAVGKPLAATPRALIAVLATPQRVPKDMVRRVLAKAPKVPKIVPTPSFTSRRPKRHEALSESLKHAVSVYDFVSQFVTLNEQGQGWCPFHDDQERSFSVQRERNYWHCFAGCGGGSLIDFWMKWRARQGQDASFTATVKDLRGLLLK